MAGLSALTGFAAGAAVTLLVAAALSASPFASPPLSPAPASPAAPPTSPAADPPAGAPDAILSRPAPAAVSLDPLSADSIASLIDLLRARRLAVPVEGVTREALQDHFDDPRGTGRAHRAIDILAPRHTPVVAVDDGHIARLYLSNGGGGIAIYHTDPTGTFGYYYAHLERYAPELEEGDPVRRGQVIGTVGTTGNAPAGTPHLHFAISLLDDPGRWWAGTPINPFLVYQD